MTTLTNSINALSDNRQQASLASLVEKEPNRIQRIAAKKAGPRANITKVESTIASLNDFEAIVTDRALKIIGKSLEGIGIFPVLQYRFKPKSMSHNGWECKFFYFYKDDCGKADPAIDTSTSKAIILSFDLITDTNKAIAKIDNCLTEIAKAYRGR